MLRRTTLPVSAFVVSALLSSSACQKTATETPSAQTDQAEVSVRTVPVKTSDVPLEISAVGNVEALSSVDVKSRVAGQIRQAFFSEGQDIAAGQLLFEIDPEPLQQQIAQIHADLAKDEAVERQARANVAKDQALLVQAKSLADRDLLLLKDRIVSREQAEQAVASRDSAAASLEADKAAVESAVASARSDRARLAQAELQLSCTKIKSPIAGRAGAILVKPGNLVKDNDAVLVTILQTTPIGVTFGVPQNLLPEIVKYNAARPLEIEASTGTATAVGRLIFVDNIVDSTTATIKLKARFDNAARTLWPGLFVDVKARLTLEHFRIVVPSRTVQTGPQGKFVWVLDIPSKTVAMRPVSVDRVFKPANGGEMAVIRDGVKPGEMVVSEGQMRLMPGAKVRILSGESQS